MRLLRNTVALLLGAVMALAPIGVVGAKQTTDCKAYNEKTVYVVCVDVSAQKGSVRSASKGVIGDKVIETFDVTTSRKDTDGPNANKDTLTVQGQFVAYNPQEETGDGLDLFIGFGAGKQGVHAYPLVGEGYDSSGCVRVPKSYMKRIWSLLVTGSGVNLVKAGKVEVHVYP